MNWKHLLEPASESINDDLRLRMRVTSARHSTRYAKPLGPDISLEHLADVTLVRYPLSVGLGLDGREQTLR